MKMVKRDKKIEILVRKKHRNKLGLKIHLFAKRKERWCR